MWWRGHELLSSDYSVSGDRVVNSIVMGPLARGDHTTVLTCLASNNNISVPVSSKVTVNMILPPTSVSITTPAMPLSAGTEYLLECDTGGSVPSPTVSWFLGTDLLGNKKRIFFTPSHNDQGQVITCRAENIIIMEDTWTITVYCKIILIMCYCYYYYYYCRPPYTKYQRCILQYY